MPTGGVARIRLILPNDPVGHIVVAAIIMCLCICLLHCSGVCQNLWLACRALITIAGDGYPVRYSDWFPPVRYWWWCGTLGILFLLTDGCVCSCMKQSVGLIIYGWRRIPGVYCLVCLMVQLFRGTPQNLPCSPVPTFVKDCFLDRKSLWGLIFSVFLFWVGYLRRHFWNWVRRAAHIRFFGAVFGVTGYK